MSQACQGRRDISRWHSGMVPVERKQYGVQDLVPPPPLQPSSPTYPVSPTSSQYGLFHFIGSTASFFSFSIPIYPVCFLQHFVGFLFFFQSHFCNHFKAIFVLAGWKCSRRSALWVLRENNLAEFKIFVLDLDVLVCHKM